MVSIVACFLAGVYSGCYEYSFIGRRRIECGSIFGSPFDGRYWGPMLIIILAVLTIIISTLFFLLRLFDRPLDVKSVSPFPPPSSFPFPFPSLSLSSCVPADGVGDGGVVQEIIYTACACLNFVVGLGVMWYAADVHFENGPIQYKFTQAVVASVRGPSAHQPQLSPNSQGSLPGPHRPHCHPLRRRLPHPLSQARIHLLGLPSPFCHCLELG